jgi:hypothetical protein
LYKTVSKWYFWSCNIFANICTFIDINI